MSGSVHEKLNRVRKPRVHIAYEVETEGAQVTRELPFIVGVMGDFSGDPTQPLRPLSDRKFAQIDRDNFNDVMGTVAPQVSMKVENTLEKNGSEMSVALDFKSMEDFEPHKVVEKVEPLKKLMDTRNKLRDLLTKADRSDALETLLEEILSNTKAMSALSGELGIGKDGGKDKGGK